MSDDGELPIQKRLAREAKDKEPPRGLKRLWAEFPSLDREERRELTERVALGAQRDVDFIVMMVLSSLLASLGLVEGSTAVVIGAMLVAPLMGPLVAGGLALVQGNVALWVRSLGVSAAGIGLGLGTALAVGVFTAGIEPTAEIEARSLPDLGDLAVAFASGVAVAYANSRANVIQSLAGVAIAAALVPPLAVVGLTFVNGYFYIAGAASILLATNLVMIVLGAAFAFRLLGLRESRGGSKAPLWARRATMLLVFAGVLLLAPLVLNALQKRRVGVTKPLLLQVAPRTRAAVMDYLEDWPEVELVLMGRASVGTQRAIGVLLTSYGPVPSHVRSDLERIVQRERGEEIDVRVFVSLSAFEDHLGLDEVRELEDEAGSEGGAPEGQ